MNIDQTTTNKSNSNDKPILTQKEASEYLGITRSYLYKLTSKKRIRHYKPAGKLTYFERIDLDAWLRQNPVATQEEIERKAWKDKWSGPMSGRIGGGR